MVYNFNVINDIAEAKVDLQRLKSEIETSNITPILKRIDQNSQTLSIYFQANLSTEENEILTALVQTHSGEPLPVEEPLTNVAVSGRVFQSAFADKTIDEGKIFRRKHSSGWVTINANTSAELIITVPYSHAKIDKAEIIGCREGDNADLCVHDTDTGLISTIPEYLLNQFGFGVAMPNGMYIDESKYEADLFLGMKIKVTYYNNSTESRLVAVNFTLHEVVAY